MLRALIAVSLMALSTGCGGKIEPNATTGAPCEKKEGIGPNLGSNCAPGLLCRSGKCVKDKVPHGP